LAYVNKQYTLVQEVPSVLMGMFCLLHLFIPHLLCHTILQAHPKCLLTTSIMGAVLSMLLMLKDNFSASFQATYLLRLFYLTLLWCLPFTSSLLFIMSQGDINWLGHLLLGLTVFTIWIDWGMILLVSILGIGLNLFPYPYFGPIYWHTSSTALIAYEVTWTLVSALLFSHIKQKPCQQLAHTCQQLMLTHSLHEADYLYSLQYQALQKQQLELQKEPLATAKAGLRFLAKLMPLERSLSQRGLEQLDAFVNYYKKSFYYSMDAMQLKLSTCSLKDLLAKINLALHDATLTNRILIQLSTKQENITCDVEKIVQLLASHLKELAKQFPAEYKIQLAIHDTELCYRLQVVTQKEWLRKLPALAFMLCPQGPQGVAQETPPLQSSYMGNTTPVPLEVPKTAVELPQLNQAQVIEAH